MQKITPADTPVQRVPPVGIGLHNAKVVIAPADPKWPLTAEVEGTRIKECLFPYEVVVHHIGSTSIPGMVAKPIVDLAIAVSPSVLDKDLNEIIHRMRNAGYRYLGDWKRRGGHFFESAHGALRTHAVQIHRMGSPDLARLLRFRELMLSKPDLARQYSAVKLSLASVLSGDRGLYFWYKSHWLNDIMLDDCGPRAWGDWWLSAQYPTMFQFVWRSMVRALSSGRRGSNPMAP